MTHRDVSGPECIQLRPNVLLHKLSDDLVRPMPDSQRSPRWPEYSRASTLMRKVEADSVADLVRITQATGVEPWSPNPV